MITRIVSGLCFGAALLLVTWYGGLAFPLVAAVGAVVGLREFYALASHGGSRPLHVAGGAAAVLLIGAVGLAWPPMWIGAIVAAVPLVTLVLLLPAGGTPTARSVLLDWGATMGGLVYLVPPLALLVILRAGHHGLPWVALLFAVTWSCDTVAFFAGRSLGRTPFFNAISPKKTREGAIAGLLGGAVAALAVDQAARLGLHPAVALLAGATIAIAAEAGDLVESLLKRQAGVKDSGTLIPGHGGLLDRIDGLLFAAVVTFYWYLLT